MNKSHLDSVLIPEELARKGLSRVFRYSGHSMHPTFQHGQLLYVRPDVEDVQAGDIVVYEEGGRFIVHRVMSVEKNGEIFTRGDNNEFPDIHPVSRNHVIGRVEVNRSPKGYTSVWGGSQGMWIARIRPIFLTLINTVRFLFGWPYRALKKSQIAPRFWKPTIYKLCLQTELGHVEKFIYRNRTVAVWYAEMGRFECQKPFDLVINSPKEK